MRHHLQALVEAGTSPFSADDARGLIAANVTGYLASLSSLSFAFSFALHDAHSLRPLIIGNVISAVCTAATPLFHRCGRIAAAIWLTGVFFLSLAYFTSLLGRETGVILNLMGASAVAFAILGLRRARLVLLITVASAALILVCWMQYPAAAVRPPNIDRFTRQIFITTIVSIMAILFVVNYYAFYLAEQAQARTEELLRAIMPGDIVDRLKRHPGTTIAQRHEDVQVLLGDLVGFTELSNQLGPERIVILLDELFRAFDALANRYRVEKIKTIGDAYLAACGLPSPHDSPADSITAMALAMHAAVHEISQRTGRNIQLRIGIAQGAVTAGVVGQSKYFYDIWGPAVNLAARLQTAAVPGQTLISDELKIRLTGRYRFQDCKRLNLKGFGCVDAWAVAQADAETEAASPQ